MGSIASDMTRMRSWRPIWSALTHVASRSVSCGFSITAVRSIQTHLSACEPTRPQRLASVASDSAGTARELTGRHNLPSLKDHFPLRGARYDCQPPGGRIFSSKRPFPRSNLVYSLNHSEKRSPPRYASPGVNGRAPGRPIKSGTQSKFPSPVPSPGTRSAASQPIDRERRRAKAQSSSLPTINERTKGRTRAQPPLPPYGSEGGATPRRH
jgi:hypothetical protein